MPTVFHRRLRSDSRPLHVAVFASLAIAQPLFDVLGRAPEFLLAHDLGPGEILALSAALGLVVPAVSAAGVALIGHLHAGAGRAAASGLVGGFASLVALQAMRNIPAPAGVLVGAALAAGAAFGAAYHRSSATRTFTAWLAPGILIFPLVFLLRPGVLSLVWPTERELAHASTSETPVVLVVFDGLPLTALLDEERQIDPDLYPAFAGLAKQSTWYRNATTVSDYTRWAIPAILSGKYPNANALPTATHHPQTLFSLLGSSHAVSVHEPISRLCPQSLCDYGGEGVVHELIEFSDTLAATYLHTVLPESLGEQLPPIDQGWTEGIPPSERPGEVWLRSGEQSRRSEALAFIDSIEAEPQPAFYYFHVLLPHTPLAYMPGGERYGTERQLPGLQDGRDRWQDDEWAVTQGQRRFLLQVGYVDALLEQLTDRLREVGLFDRALLVVTSDHGASFKPGSAFRRVTDESYMDVLPVPLLVKAPNQQEGETSDRNVETVDILPTIADILNIEIPWRVDGMSAVSDTLVRPRKTVYYENAKRVRTFGPTVLEEAYRSVERRLRIFGSRDNPYRIPRSSPAYELIGRSVDELPVTDGADDVEFSIDVHGDFANVRADLRFVPAFIAGRARWLDSAQPATVAVAVNGRIRATTRTYSFTEAGSRHAWSAVIPPDAFQAGENELDIFVVRPSNPPVLYRTHVSHERPVNLLSNAAAYGLRVTHDGLYDPTGQGEGWVRWTNGAARVTVPREARDAPRALRVNLGTTGPAEKDVRILVNGCELFEGVVSPGAWSRIFGLSDCGGGGDATVIELLSGVHDDVDAERKLGVAVSRIDLLDAPWPPPAAPIEDDHRRSHIRLDGVPDGSTVASDRTLTATIVNRGGAILAPPGDLAREFGAVRLGVLWFGTPRTETPVAIQRVELPRALVPGDSVRFDFQLVARTSDGAALPQGDYEAWIGLFQEGMGWFYDSGDSVRKLRVVHDARP